MLQFIIVMTFCSVFAMIWLILYVTVVIKESPESGLKRRLKQMERIDRKGRSFILERKSKIFNATSRIEELFSYIFLYGLLQKLITQSGVKIKPTQFIILISIFAIAGFLFGFLLTHNYLVSFLVCLFSGIIPFLYLVYLRKKRIEKFTQQFPDALTMISRSLRAGHSLTGAIQLIASEMSEPTSELFRSVYEQQMLGLGIRESLSTMIDKIDSIDLRFFITAVTLHYEIGGNLAELLDKLAHTIRERMRIRREVRVFTAQVRLSGYILAFLPLIVFGIFYLLLPHYEEVLIKTNAGNMLIGIGIIGQIAGYLIIRRIINIRI